MTSSPIDKDKLTCSYCGKWQRTKETYWDLVGHPKRFNKPGSIRANSVTLYGSDGGLNYAPQKVISSDNVPSCETSWMATVPKAEIESMYHFVPVWGVYNHYSFLHFFICLRPYRYFCSCSPCFPYYLTWINDSRASYHMTGLSSLFS